MVLIVGAARQREKEVRCIAACCMDDDAGRLYLKGVQAAHGTRHTAQWRNPIASPPHQHNEARYDSNGWLRYC